MSTSTVVMTGTTIDFNKNSPQPAWRLDRRHPLAVTFIENIRADLNGHAPCEADLVPGKLVRFSTNTDPKDMAGYAKLFADGQGGVYGCWRQGISGSWQARQPQTHEERTAFAERVKVAKAEAAKEEEQRRADCREKAAAIWNAAQPAPADHPYALKKEIIPYGCMLSRDSLVVPVYRADGQLVGLQFIKPDGKKKFLTGTAKAGCFCPIGKPGGDTVVICEGYATGASIHQATGLLVVVAFDCGNLLSVAAAVREKRPSYRIILAADDDHSTPGNPGLTRAREAAQAIGGLLAVPVFPEGKGAKDSDFNDLGRLAGLEAVKQCIEAAAPLLAVLAVPHPANSETFWPEPVPLPDGLPPVKALEPEMIPDPLRGWLMDISERMQIPPDFSAAAAIVGLGSVIGRGCGIHPKRRDDWLVIPNLWGAVVGRPSLMKTPAVSDALRHLVRLEAESREEYLAAVRCFELDSEFTKISKSAHQEELKKAIKKGDTAAVEAGRAKLAAAQEKDEPVRRRYQTQDGTVEKLGELLNTNPRGLLVNRDELLGWFRSMDRDGRDGDRAFYLESWNGNGRFTYDRIGRGTLDIPALCLSIFGCITPGPLASYVYQANRGGVGDDGLLQRFQVVVWPDAPNEWKNVDRFPDTKEKDRAWGIFKAMSGEIPGAIIEDKAEIPALRFSLGGQEVFDTWRHDLEVRLRGDHGLPPAMESHLTKYRKLMPALALIFHLAAVADSEPPGPVSEQATLMSAAWCDYLESHTGRVYAAATMPGMESAGELVKHLRRGAIQDGSRIRDIHRNQWSRLSSPDEVRAGIEVLQEYDWLTIEKTATGGRPSEIIRLNPRIML